MKIRGQPAPDSLGEVIKKLEELDANATVGPWKISDDGDFLIGTVMARKTAAYIVALRTLSLPALRKAEARIAELEARLAEAEAEATRLRGKVEEAAKVIEPFANIAPSSLYPANGSEEEMYQVYLTDTPALGEFTGADLSRARDFFFASLHPQAEDRKGEETT